MWHYDDYNVEPWNVYTIIFYLRSDSTVIGGNLNYRDGEMEKELKVRPCSYALFPGNIYHSPQHSTGFGCRDSVVVFVRRT